MHHLDLSTLEIIVLSEKDLVLGQGTEFASENLCVLKLAERRGSDEKNLASEIAPQSVNC